MKRHFFAVAALALFSCDKYAQDGSTPLPAPSALEVKAAVRSAEAAPKEAPAPSEKFDKGAAAFAAAKDVLLKKYYKEGLDEDDVYRAATLGLLEHFDPEMKAWNKLLSPSELAEITRDLHGEVVGVGVEIKFAPETGYTEVLGVIPKSAAERAGVERGDLIVSIDDHVFKGATQREVVNHIRGKAGDSVKLTILRDGKLLTLDVVRELVALDAVTHFLVGGRVGYLRVRSFNEKTAEATKAALDDLAAKRAEQLVVDLRENQGGSFDAAIAVAGMFLPKGAPIVKTKKRGEREEVATATGATTLANAPLAVLIDGGTSSGAELVAGALSEERQAKLVGSRTFGKWSVQMLEELANGWAIKYTVSLFTTPNGKSYEGVGLAPDVEVDFEEHARGAAMAITDPDARLAADVQLRTAVSILRR